MGTSHASRLIDMAPASSLFYLLLIGTSVLSGYVGHHIANRAGPTKHPQTFIGLYSLVRVAAASTESIGYLMMD